MSTDVTVRQPHAVATLEDMKEMANAIAKSGLFGVKEPVQALALMCLAQAEGQHPATIAQDYDIIAGRAARKTHSVLSRFQQAGGTVKWIQLSETVAEAAFTHAMGGTVTIKWTIEMADKIILEKYDDSPGAPRGAKIKYALSSKDNWKNFPRSMLRARCIAEGIRAVFPGAIGGMLLSEEAQDLPQITEKDMGKAVQVEQPKAKPKTASPPSSQSSAPSAASAGDAVQSSAPQDDGVHPDAQSSQGPAAAEPIEGELLPRENAPTLADCLALADKACETKGGLAAIMPTLLEYRKALSVDEQATLDSTLTALIVDQGLDKVPSGPPLSAGQRRILTARLKSNGKTMEQFEAKFGAMDSCPAASWEAAQAWASAT